MQMLKKIFNSDKKYYLELDEIKESKPVQAVVETAEKVTDVVRDKASEVLESEPAKETVETAKKTQDVAQNKLKSTTKTKSKPQADSKPKADKNGQAAKSEENTKAKPSPQDAGASPDEPPFWVAAMYNNNSKTDMNSDGQKAEQTFATDNLMPTITRYRRRPGASLSKFKDMASKVKTPKG